jgi:hypothetical protein
MRSGGTTDSLLKQDPETVLLYKMDQFFLIRHSKVVSKIGQMMSAKSTSNPLIGKKPAPQGLSPSQGAGYNSLNAAGQRDFTHKLGIVVSRHRPLARRNHESGRERFPVGWLNRCGEISNHFKKVEK